MKRKSNYYKILVYVIILLGASNTHAQINPGKDFDLQGFINQKINAGEKQIIIPPGRYRVSEFNNTHINIGEKNDITIIADGVEMICTETVPAIKIKNCNNFKLQGISIDYDPLPFTQGKIVAMSSDKNTLTFDIINGYSKTLTGDKLEIYNPNTGELSTTTYYGVTYTVNQQTGRVVLTKPSNYKLATSHEEVGDIVVIGSKNNKSSPHAILPDGCTNLVMENVTLYAGPTFGFFETNCSGSHYLNCKVDRRPLATDIRERDVKRMQSNNADAFHSKHAEVGPSYIRCEARYNGDDGIAINGDYHVVTGTNGTKVTVVPKAAGSLNMVVGDSVELVSYTGNRLPNAIITKIETGPALNSTEKQFLQNQTFNGGAANTYKASNVYYVTINSSVNMPMGSLIASANRIGNGFEVKDCTIGPNRSRGILVKASNGIITGNRLVSNWGQAIKLAPEYVWLEAGSGSNVIVSNNVISGCHDAAIAVYANGGNGAVAPIGAHNNIQISGNLITESSNPAIAVTSTSKLKLTNNIITSPNNSFLVPWIMNSFGRNEDPGREIYLQNIELVESPLNASINRIGARANLISNIYPNPVTGNHLYVNFNTANSLQNIEIFDAMGKLMYVKEKCIETEINIDVSRYRTGMYFLKVQKNGKNDFRKIIIE